MNFNRVETEEEAINWINSLKNFGIKPGLQRMKWMLEQFGNPEQKIKFIHVAGTNGKGSTVSFLKNVLVESNYRVGTFTSPYLINFTERVQVNGVDISCDDLVQLVNKVIPIVEMTQNLECGYATEFEVITLIAILYFAEISKPDIVVWETGLGGRLDSTNVVKPILSIVTNVGYDHMNILGNDIKDIAREKAGIIKNGVPIVSGVENVEALSVIKEIGQMQASPMYQINEQFFYQIHTLNQWGSKFDFSSDFGSLSNIEIEMIGPHQIKNAAISLMALQVLIDNKELLIDSSTIYKGMKQTSWPGRFEILFRDPTVIIDGAHNFEGAKSLKETLSLYKYRKLIMVVGILEDKNIKKYFETIMTIVDHLIITEPQVERAAKVEEVIDVVGGISQKIDIHQQKNWQKAIQEALRISTSEDLVIVTGSLFLISDVRKFLLNIYI